MTFKCGAAPNQEMLVVLIISGIKLTEHAIFSLVWCNNVIAMTQCVYPGVWPCVAALKYG